VCFQVAPESVKCIGWTDRVRKGITKHNFILFLPQVALPNIFPIIMSWSKFSCLRTCPSHLCLLHQIIFNMLLASLAHINTSSSVTFSVQLIFSIFHHIHISNTSILIYSNILWSVANVKGQTDRQTDRQTESPGRQWVRGNVATSTDGVELVVNKHWLTGRNVLELRFDAVISPPSTANTQRVTWLVSNDVRSASNSFNFLVIWALSVTIFHSKCIFCVYGTLLANTAVVSMCVRIVYLPACGAPWWVLVLYSIMMQRLFFIVECSSVHFLCAVCVFNVQASSSSPRLPLCQISFLSQPPLLSWPMEKNHILTHSLTQYIWCPGNQTLFLRISYGVSHQSATFIMIITSLLETRLINTNNPPQYSTTHLLNTDSLHVIIVSLCDKVFQHET